MVCTGHIENSALFTTYMCSGVAVRKAAQRTWCEQTLKWPRSKNELKSIFLYYRGSSCLESPSDQKDGYGSPYCSPLSPRSPQAIGLQENTVMLDEMTLRHMVQDCTTVKTQLLKLKRFLQQVGCSLSTV